MSATQQDRAGLIVLAAVAVILLVVGGVVVASGVRPVTCVEATNGQVCS